DQYVRPAGASRARPGRAGVSRGEGIRGGNGRAVPDGIAPHIPGGDSPGSPARGSFSVGVGQVGKRQLQLCSRWIVVRGHEGARASSRAEPSLRRGGDEREVPGHRPRCLVVWGPRGQDDLLRAEPRQEASPSRQETQEQKWPKRWERRPRQEQQQQRRWSWIYDYQHRHQRHLHLHPHELCCRRDYY
ncbi:unnamed protein product, partial [Ectocarpus sp. 8 AP-2014]